MERSIPSEVRTWITESRERIQTFQDRWHRDGIEQFVASDYELVYQTLDWIVERRLMAGNRFLEWGCGFSVICALAARLGLDAIGIEAEERLLQEGRKTIAAWDQPVELIHGNFLPPDMEQWADDPTLPSLGHPVACGYDQLGLEVDDFAMIFAYPWPGEEDFLKEVFARSAATDSLLLQFCGPYDLRLWRKIRYRSNR